MEGLQGKLDKLTTKSIGVEVKLDKVKKTSITEFKEFDAYKLDLNITVAQFFAKERLKTKQFLWKLHQIEDISFLDGIADELTFSNYNEEEME